MDVLELFDRLGSYAALARHLRITPQSAREQVLRRQNRWGPNGRLLPQTTTANEPTPEPRGLPFPDRGSEFLLSAACRGAPLDPRCITAANELRDKVYPSARVTLMEVGAHNRALCEWSESPLDPDCYKYPIIHQDEDRAIGPALRAYAMNIKPQQVDPLSGLERLVTESNSLIVGSPKRRAQHFPTYGKVPPVAVSTMACTQPRYLSNKVGQVARAEHQLGWLYIRLRKSGSFNYRHIPLGKDGHLYDLGWKSNGQRATVANVNLADLHSGDTDARAWAATIRLLRHLQPRSVTINDLMDNRTLSHHEKKQHVTRYKNDATTPLLEEGFAIAAQYLRQIREAVPNVTIYILPSNHDEWLNRRLEEANFEGQHRNLRALYYLGALFCDGKNPTAEGLRRFGGLDEPWVRVLERSSHLKIAGNRFEHGDEGNDGSRGSPLGYARMGNISVGHSHRAWVWGDADGVGTLSPPSPYYGNGGPHTHTCTHGILYENGCKQQVTVIDGEY